MAKYNYFCDSKECTIGDYLDSDKDGLIISLKEGVPDPREELLVWEVSHGMGESPEIVCPVCGAKAVKHLGYIHSLFHIRGNWALNKADCKRQMDIHALDKGTGYEQYYEPGEKDEIRNKLIRNGKRIFVDLERADREMAEMNAKEARAMKLVQSFNKKDTEVRFV